MIRVPTLLMLKFKQHPYGPRMIHLIKLILRRNKWVANRFEKSWNLKETVISFSCRSTKNKNPTFSPGGPMAPCGPGSPCRVKQTNKKNPLLSSSYVLDDTVITCQTTCGSLTCAPGLPCCPGGPGSPWGPCTDTELILEVSQRTGS